MDQFDKLMDRFGIWDATAWSEVTRAWFRERAYSDGAWLNGHRIEPISFWGA